MRSIKFRAWDKEKNKMIVWDDLSYYTGKNNIIYDNKKFNSFGIGFGIGKKWVNKQGFVFQFVLGGGRTISGGYSAPEYIFQGDISIGYRF